METRPLALSLALATAAAPGVWPADLERTSRAIETALALPPDTPIAVQTRDRTRHRGRLRAVTESHLTLRTLRDGAIADITLPYSNITSLKRTDKPMSPAKAVLVTIAVLWGAGTILGALVNH